MTDTDTNDAQQTVEVPAWTNSWAQRNYLWPVPQIEKDLNGKLGQNAGWE